MERVRNQIDEIISPSAPATSPSTKTQSEIEDLYARFIDLLNELNKMLSAATDEQGKNELINKANTSISELVDELVKLFKKNISPYYRQYPLWVWHSMTTNKEIIACMKSIKSIYDVMNRFVLDSSFRQNDDKANSLILDNNELEVWNNGSNPSWNEEENANAMMMVFVWPRLVRDLFTGSLKLYNPHTEEFSYTNENYGKIAFYISYAILCINARELVCVDRFHEHAITEVITELASDNLYRRFKHNIDADFLLYFYPEKVKAKLSDSNFQSLLQRVNSRATR